jgi:hypothetical protein
MNKHGLYAIGLGPTLLGGVTAQNLAVGSEVRGEATSGEIYARFKSLYAQRSAPSFSTHSIRTALNVLGALGANIASLSGGLALYAQKWADGGSRTAGSAHRKFAFDRGIVYPTRLEIPHQGDATLTVAALVTSADGTTAPLTITDAVALPAISDAEERFSLGPISVGGVALTSVGEVAIDFATVVAGESADGNIFDEVASIQSHDPVITIRGRDPEWLKSSNIPLSGKAATHANTAIYLRRRLAGGTYATGSNHIVLGAAGMAVIDEAFGATHGQAGESAVVLSTVFDGTNAPLAIAIDQALE